MEVSKLSVHVNHHLNLILKYLRLAPRPSDHLITQLNNSRAPLTQTEENL